MVLGIMIVFGRVLISSVTHIATITFVLIVDLMPTGAKAVATQIALLTFNIGIFIPSFLYPNLDQLIGAFAFLPFSFISLGFFVYFYFNLIETKEKEIYENLEILGHMPESVNFVNNVKRKRATSLMPLLEDDEIVRRKMIKYDSFGV
uniref:Uncharacterized protein n=1 Tax=Acrobeloides nanus TaxID=290746 RepID=A0A914ENN6_9BILA